MVNVIISGCNGHMGRVVESICNSTPGVQVVAGFDVLGSTDRNFPVYSSPAPFTGKADAVIDFSSPAALDGLLGQVSGDGEGIRHPAHAQEPAHNQRPHHRGGPQEQRIPRGQRRHQQRGGHRHRQGNAGLDGFIRLGFHHSFTGTGVFFSTRMTTLWAVTPFMRLSGLSTRRWDKTGIAMCCTSSGMM